MRTLYKILRAFIVTLFVCTVVIPAAVYLLLSSDWAQQQLCAIAQQELTSLLGTEVRIGDVYLHAFGRLRIHDVEVDDDLGETALRIGTVETRAEMFDFLLRRKIIIDYATVDSLGLKLYRDSAGAPLNIDGIVRRLSSEEEKPQSVFDLRLNNISVSNASVSYDVLDAPQTPGRFNPRHVSVTDLNTEIFAPRIANNFYRLWLRTFNCLEQSGLCVTDLSVDADITDKSLHAGSLELALPFSRLVLDDIDVPLDGIKSIQYVGTRIPVPLSVLEGSHIYLPDLSPFVGAFADMDVDLGLALTAMGVLSDIDIENLTVTERQNDVSLSLSGVVTGLPDISAMHTDRLQFKFNTMLADALADIPMLKTRVSDRIGEIVSIIGETNAEGTITGGIDNGKASVSISTGIGSAVIDATYRNLRSRRRDLVLKAAIDSLDLNSLLPGKELGLLSAGINAEGVLSGTDFDGTADINIGSLGFRGYTYHGIKADITADSEHQLANLTSTDPNLRLNAWLGHSITEPGRNSIEATVLIENFRTDTLNLARFLPAGTLASNIDLRYDGSSLDDFQARLEVKRTRYRATDGKRLNVTSFIVDADNTTDFGHVWINSDFLNGSVDGRIRPSLLRDDVVSIAKKVFPVLSMNFEIDDTPEETREYNAFSYDFSINRAEDVCSFFNLPYYVVGEGTIKGHVREDLGDISLIADLPYIQKGNKLIENTLAEANINADGSQVHAFFTTNTPTGKGPMSLTALVEGGNGRLHSTLDWRIKREEQIAGQINFTTYFSRTVDDDLRVMVEMEPGIIDFGDDVWNIQPSVVTYTDSRIKVNNFSILAGEQSLLINGVAGSSPDDLLTVSIRDFNMVNIFETLGINNALIGGYVTGDIYGAGLLGKDMEVVCDGLAIRGISYNYCTLGDAMAKAWFDTERQSFVLDIDVTGVNGSPSHILGSIKPATEELDLTFDCDGIPVSFLQPFMAAFSSGIQGHVSGHARLYGSFSDIDLDGDVYADNVRLKIDIINVWYNASDSIHIRPGRINLDGIRIFDDYGHSGMLKGYVGHRCFHDATFDISVVDARDLLCFDVTKAQQPNWYGRIFGDGTASVIGVPGHVDITANMSTSRHSEFTFELSDQASASEYSFLTFRDVTPIDPLARLNSDTPERVTYLRRLAQTKSYDSHSTYNMDISVDANRNAAFTLVLDPVGGDQIKATGDGHIRMTYESQDEDLRLYGTYTLAQGNYNFSLQDIILKNFTIKPGSSITFNGDPYRADLDIEAYIGLNANLSDLDESFLTDKELNRTNVPVRALMSITGDMRQPDLSFDLEFPTLTQDIYRKVRSIISTEEMMNKQIIYLLALNRFFTPEYMSATKGNELFSVASSTIASQLSNILGKLSDNWSIAPNLRSDKGDFSDVEIDVNLSSSLLNNRLLFNGNFGYRDKSLNTNQFVGDFDVEYLLTRSGMWRLKAYNRYNDQNYYLRTAQTTQGVGIVYKKDFDNLFNFLSNGRREEETAAPTVIEDNVTVTDHDAVPDSTLTEDISVKTIITPSKEKE